MAVGKLGFEITADATDAQRDLQRIGQDIQTLATRAGVSFEQMGTDAAQGMNRAANAVDNFAAEAQESFSEAAAAARKYEAQITAVGKGNDKAMRSTTGATANIAAQFQDIGVQAQQGTSWMTVALQQGTQLSAVFAGMGKEGVTAWSAIGGAIKSVFSWQSILITGFVALATVSIQWLLKMIPVAEDANEKLKKHEEWLQHIKTAYGQTFQGVEAFNKAAGAVDELKAMQEVAKQTEEFNIALRDTADNTIGLKNTAKLFDVLDQKIPTVGKTWRTVLTEVARGETTWAAVIKVMNDAGTAGSIFDAGIKKVSRGTINLVNGLQDAVNTGFAPLNTVMDAFWAQWALGDKKLAPTIEKLVDLFKVAPKGSEFSKAILQQIADLQGLTKEANDAEQAMWNYTGMMGRWARIESRQAVKKREEAGRVAQQEKYNDAIQGMADASKQADNESRKLLKTELHRAQAAAHTMEQWNHAKDVYNENSAALNTLLANTRLHTDFLAEAEAAQQGYNDALAAITGTVPAVVQSNEQIIASNYQLALSYAQTKEERDKAAEVRDETQRQTTANTAMNSFTGQLQKMQTLGPVVAQTARQALEAWYASAAPINATTVQLEALVIQYANYQAQLNEAQAKMGLMGTLQQAAAGSFQILTDTIADYTARIQAGTATTGDLRTALEGLREAIPAPEFQAQVDALIAVIDQEEAAAAEADGLASAYNEVGAAGGVAAAGANNAAGGFTASGNAAAGAIGAVLGLASAYRSFMAAQSGFGPVLESNVKSSAQINANLDQQRKAAATFKASPIAAVQAQGIKMEADALAQYTRELTNNMHYVEVNNKEKQRMLELNESVAAKAKADAEALRKSKGGGGGGGGGGQSETEKAAADVEQWANAMLDTIEPARVLARETEMLNAAVAAGLVTDEQKIQILERLKQKYGETAAATFDLQKEFGNMMQQWGDQVASSLASAIVNGEDLGEVFKKLLLQLAEMALQMLVLKPLMGSIMGAFGVPAVGGLAAPVPPAANSNFRLPAPGMLGGRSATVGGGRGTTNNATMGGVTINFNGDGKSDVAADGHRAKAMGERLRSVVQGEMVRQSRPGGLMWNGGGGRR